MGFIPKLANSSKISPAAVIAWTLSAAVVLFALASPFTNPAAGTTGDNPVEILTQLLQQLPYIVSGIVGALIIARQPRNTIGWLLMLMAFPILLLAAIPTSRILSQISSSGSTPSPLIWLLVWVNGWGWWFLIGPLLLIPVLFPTGRPPSPRWRWVIGGLAFLFLLFVTLATFAERLDDQDLGVNFQNPIGFIPIDVLNAFFNGPWSLLLGAITVLCVSAIFVRYRRAGFVERQQIKWLLIACLFFAVMYAPNFWSEGEELWFLGAGFYLGTLAIPTSIGIAILRYRLFDVDVIIRRTLTYTLVTVLLAIIFFGSVIVLQQIFSGVTASGQNEIVTVLSTLAIAALFVPVRSRIQTEIDKRFNRKKYDARQVLADYANTVRDETNLENLTGRLMQIVGETVQPSSVSVWLKRDVAGPGPERTHE